MNMIRNFLKTVAVAVVAFSVPGIGTANAATFRLTIGASHPEAAIWVEVMRDFLAPEIAKRVEQKTGHKIEWVNAYGGSICKVGECLEAVESGLLDIAEIQPTFEPSKLMAHNFAYAVPFGPPDPVMAARVGLKIYDTVPGLNRILDKYNQLFLALGPSGGNYGLVTTFPWEKVEQLKGRKIAAAGPNIPWLQAVGAIPVTSNLVEAYTSLQSGVYQGWLMFPVGVVGFKLHEVAKNFTFTDFGSMAAAILITVNKNTWAKLPKPVQDIMTEVGREYVEVVSKRTAAQEQRSIDAMKAAGVNIRSLSDAEIVKWANALPEIPSQRAAEIRKAGHPGEVVAAYLKALKDAGVKLPRDWTVR